MRPGSGSNRQRNRVLPPAPTGASADGVDDAGGVGTCLMRKLGGKVSPTSNGEQASSDAVSAVTAFEYDEEAAPSLSEASAPAAGQPRTPSTVTPRGVLIDGDTPRESPHTRTRTAFADEVDGTPNEALP